MSYESELAPLLDWVRTHPLSSEKQIRQEIKAMSWRPPYDGTRLAIWFPSINELTWKLRYLELSGAIKQHGKGWVVT